MTNHEGDSTRGIVDIETFGIWLVNYREGLIADPNIQKQEQHIDGSPLEGVDTSVGIPDLPWENIPESIQILLMLQHDAANIPGKKSVDVHIHETAIEFEFNSPLVIDGLDTVGETLSTRGITLTFMEEGIIGHSFNGKWYIPKSLPSSRLIGERIARKIMQGGKIQQDEYDRLLGTHRNVTMPSTLGQLHDIASLLVRERSRIEVVHLTTDPA